MHGSNGLVNSWLIRSETGLLAAATVIETIPNLPAATEGQEIVADYASLGLTLRRHPLALLRPRLTRLQLLSACELRQLPDGGWLAPLSGNRWPNVFVATCWRLHC